MTIVIEQDFINKVYGIANKYFPKDIYMSVLIAQAAHESNFGQSKLSCQPYNNLFGIKGKWKDANGLFHSVKFMTNEDDGTGIMHKIEAEFRKYNTIEHSILDYINLLTNEETKCGKIYKKAWKSNTKSYKDACSVLTGTYATDIYYGKKLIELIEKFNLTQYD